ncbi:ankyrin repeat domain-containing protein 13D-like [Branchiostoma floridae x Branchiostoma belcheri]
MPITAEQIREQFPLHWLVWHNKFHELLEELRENQHDLERMDPRGRTALHLAVTLGHLESTRALLSHGALISTENACGWTVLQEAVSTGNPELVQLTLKHRDFQRASLRIDGVPELLAKLRSTPDFYVEMKWEFTSWVPLVSRMCPSDTYKLWKKGSYVRVDTTLLGFDQMSWQRGSRSYIFKGEVDSATLMEVDHDRHLVFVESLQMNGPQLSPDAMTPTDDIVCARMGQPIVTVHMETKNIAFERTKSGIWGWRSDKSETVNGYDAKVFGAHNVEVVTRTRTEHLTEEEKERTREANKTPFQSFLGIVEEHEENLKGAEGNETLVFSNPTNPTNIMAEEYFDQEFDLGERDIGRPIEQTTKTQKFKATLWLCDQFPLTLQDQLLPIIDLMARSNAHFARLKDFITLQLPSGFPVKIEIPLFHVLNARITFGNLNGTDEEVDGVAAIKVESPTEEEVESPTEEETLLAATPGATKMVCDIDPMTFEAPLGYNQVQASGRRERRRHHDEDDALLQFAIQQSLLEANGAVVGDQMTMLEALGATTPEEYENEQLQRAIQESLMLAQGESIPEAAAGESCPAPVVQPVAEAPPDDMDAQLRLALEMSAKEQAEADRRRKEEEEELERILQLSLTDK